MLSASILPPFLLEFPMIRFTSKRAPFRQKRRGFLTNQLPKGNYRKPSGWWWLTYPSEKYESQLGLLFPIYGKKMFQTTNQPWFFAFTIQFRGKFWEIVFVFHLSLGLPTFADTQDNHFVPSPSHLRAPQSVDPFVGAPSS